MKKFKKLLPIIIPFLCVGLATGCGNKKASIKEKEINIKLLVGGYGKEWMQNAVSKFNQIYADEGYKVNLFAANKMIDGGAVYNELLSGYSEKKIDLYFTGSLKPSRCVDNGNMLVEDITESVYNQKAIGFNGKEESLTVREKLDPSFGNEWYEYEGKAYCFFYQRSIGALVVNKEKLAYFGFNDLPVTTNQFLNQVHYITEQNLKRKTLVKPIVTVSGTGYATVMMNSWFTQYQGVETWNKFWSMNNDDGTYNTATGYQVFNDEGLDKAAELLFNTYDWKNFVEGSKSSFTIPLAHASLMNSISDGGGVFLFDGDWALNETAVDYDDSELNKLAFINVPIISALGTKLWGDIITDPTVCDNVLAKVATSADEGNEPATIRGLIQSEFGYDLSEESILTVCKARGVYNNRGVETGNAYIAKGVSSLHKEIASKFLRLLASDDFSKMYFSTSRCFSPYSSVINEEELLPFSRGHSLIATHKYASAIWPFATGLREKVGTLNGMFSTQKQYFHLYAEDSNKSAYSEYEGGTGGDYVPELETQYKNAAAGALSTERSYIMSNWERWVSPYK